MGTLDSFLVSHSKHADSLEEIGLKLIEPVSNETYYLTCMSLAAKRVKDMLGLNPNLENSLVLDRIAHFIFKVRKIKPYKEIPADKSPNDFIIMYNNFFIDNLYLVDYLEAPLAGFPLLITHWAIVQSVEGGIVTVRSKFPYKGVYEHSVDNPELLETYCHGKRTYCFIDVNELKQFFLSYLASEA